MQKTERANDFSKIGIALLLGRLDEAKKIANDRFSWKASCEKRQTITKNRAVKIFYRDRFIDRYSGSNLIFPGALLAINRLMPEEFPMHPTWKAGHSHEVFWELWPVVDHVYPVSRGGSNSDDNFVTTSVINNTAKGNALLEDLGWTLHAIPADEPWDGMVGWFGEMAGRQPGLLEDRTIKGWWSAVKPLLEN